MKTIINRNTRTKSPNHTPPAPPYPDNNPTSTDQPSILPSIASNCIRQRQRAGQPKEKLAKLLILNPGWKWVWMLYECSAACRSDPDPASWPLLPGKGLDLHRALTSAAPASHEGWGGTGVRVRLLPFGAVLNPRSPSSLIGTGMSGRYSMKGWMHVKIRCQLKKNKNKDKKWLWKKKFPHQSYQILS